jgi:hypothetical protein
MVALGIVYVKLGRTSLQNATEFVQKLPERRHPKLVSINPDL